MEHSLEELVARHNLELVPSLATGTASSTPSVTS